MKSTRFFALFVMTLVASLAVAQFKAQRTGVSQKTPRTGTVAAEAPAIEPPPPQTKSDVAGEAAVDAAPVTENTPAERPADAENTASPAVERDVWLPTAIGVAALVFLLTVVGFLQQMRRMIDKVLAALPRANEGRLDRDRFLNELAVLKKDTRDQIDSLRDVVEALPGKVQQRVQNAMQQSKPTPAAPTPPPRTYETYEERRPVEDTGAQLLTLANQVVQQTPTTLEAIRASTRQLQVQVSPWPNGGEATPAAFIVEHRTVCYAIPNVVKPARLPQEWFNRSDFGVNDEIQRVVSLPRLQRRGGNDYDVMAPGVFTR